MKKIITLYVFLIAALLLQAQRTNTNQNQRQTTDNNRRADNFEMQNRDRVIYSGDSVAVFRITTNRAEPDVAPESKIKLPFKFADATKTVAKKAIMDVKNPKWDDMHFLGYAQSDIDIEKNEARFVYRLDPRGTKLNISSKADLLGTGMFGSSNNKKMVIEHDKRAYEFFYGYVYAKVNILPNQRYLMQFEVESNGYIDYYVHISKTYKEVLWDAKEWKPYLPSPRQHFFYTGNKKISVVIEPGSYSGLYYIILGGNFMDNSWKFTRFDMTPIN